MEDQDHIQRKLGELWTSYFQGRLAYGGLGNYQLEYDEDYDLLQAVVPLLGVADITIYRSVVDRPSKSAVIAEPISNEEMERLGKITTYSGLAAFEERYDVDIEESVDICSEDWGDRDDWDDGKQEVKIAVTFKFGKGDMAIAKPESPSMIFFALPQYIEPKECPAETVIDDLVGLVRKIREMEDQMERLHWGQY